MPQHYEHLEALRFRPIFEGRNVRVICPDQHVEVLQWAGSMWSVVGRYDRMSDDYAFTNAREHAERLDKRINEPRGLSAGVEPDGEAPSTTSSAVASTQDTAKAKASTGGGQP